MDKSFIEQVMDGQTSCADVDDFVDRWHEGDSAMILHEYLGMSFEDYSLWVGSPDKLEAIVARRRSATS